MNRLSQSTMDSLSCEELVEEEEGWTIGTEGEGEFIAQQVQCLTLTRRRSRRTDPSSGKNSWWRQGSKTTTKLEKQLQTRMKSEEIIEKQLDRFLDQYRCVSAPILLRDVPELLMPDHVHAHELATLTWFGDWRPSAILEVVRDLTVSSSSSISYKFSDSTDANQKLGHLISDVLIEEAIIDSELTEIQCNCVFNFPFSSGKKTRSRPVDGIQAEFQKLGRVITKAQQLRFKTLNCVVKTMLSKTGAAEFLMAFVGIQNSIRKTAINMKGKNPSALQLPWDQSKRLSSN